MNKSSGNLVCIALVKFVGAVYEAGVSEEMVILMLKDEMQIFDVK